MPSCSSARTRSKRPGAPCRNCSTPGRAIPPATSPITSPAAPVPRRPTACSHATGGPGCRSATAIRTGGASHEHQQSRCNMKATGTLHDLGQSLWLDNITRSLLKTGVLRRYIDELAVTGLTSNPTIFDHAIKNSSDYDDAIKSKLAQGKSGEKLFFELALEDIREAADLFWPVHDRTCGVDGWVSLEVSPLLAHDTKSTIAEAKDLHAQARRPNIFIKIPGTPEGLPAIEEAIFAGVPINVTLLFSDDQYVAAANAFMRGIERRIDAGLKPDVG